MLGRDADKMQRDKLKDELEYLQTEKRREVAERIKEAREFGDISENSEYDDAKNEQAMLEARIAQLEDKLRSALWLIRSIQQRQRTIVRADIGQEQPGLERGMEGVGVKFELGIGRAVGVACDSPAAVAPDAAR